MKQEFEKLCDKAQMEMKTWPWMLFLMYMVSLIGQSIGSTIDTAITQSTGQASSTFFGIGAIVGYLVALPIVLRRMKKKDIDVKTILRLHIKPRGADIWKFIVAAIAFAPVAEFIYMLTVRLFPVGEIPGDGGFSIFVVIYTAIVGPFFEEFLFRGVTYGSMRKTGNLVLATIVSAVFFGVMHGLPAQILYAIVQGLMMAYIFEKTGSLWGSIIYHIVNNSLSVIQGLLNSANPNLEDKIFFFSLDNAGNTVRMAITVICGLVIACVLLWSLKPSAEAEAYKKELDEENLRIQESFQQEGKKMKWVTVGFVACCILFILMAISAQMVS